MSVPAHAQTVELLDRLVAFESVFTAANYADIADFAIDQLSSFGFTCHRLPDPENGRAGVLASKGPPGPGGLMLSAHLDVVPVAGQPWTTDPFRLAQRGDRLYGRGTCDMKGFAASALAAASRSKDCDLRQPLKLSLSYDEEAGCVGIARMIGKMASTIGKPKHCIVGEPTSMHMALGHKGKTSYRAEFVGTAGHSANAPRFVNALHLASDLLSVLRAEQGWLAEHGRRDRAYDVAFSTIHAGTLSGGRALNVVPDSAVMEFEIRHLADEDPNEILQRIRDGAAEVEREARQRQGEARIVLSQTNAYPGFDLDPDDEIARLAADAGALLPPMKVSFGTEAGIFQQAGISTLVCGPGNMEQGHKADEYVELEQLWACDALLDRLIARICH